MGQNAQQKASEQDKPNDEQETRSRDDRDTISRKSDDELRADGVEPAADNTFAAHAERMDANAAIQHDDKPQNPEAADDSARPLPADEQ